MYPVFRKIGDEVVDLSGETMNLKSDLSANEASLYIVCISISRDYDTEVSPGICRDFFWGVGGIPAVPIPLSQVHIAGSCPSVMSPWEHHIKASFQHPPMIWAPA